MNRPLAPCGRASWAGRFVGMSVVSAAVALLGCCVDSSVAAQQPTPAPTPNPAGLLSKARGNDLARAVPFDRITLIDNTVLEVEPIAPRPLPPLETSKAGKSLIELDEAAQKRDAARRARRSGRPRGPEDDPDEEETIVIHLLEGEPRDYKVKRSSLRTVEYFEDLLLADADRLTAAGDYTRAFERQLLVKLRDPNWKGLDESVNRLLYTEGAAILGEDDGRGLLLLNELLGRAPKYPGLVDRLVAAYARKVDRAIAANDYFAGRELLRGLVKLAATHPEVVATRTKFVVRARALVEEANRANPGDRVDRLAEAARIWPEYEGLDRAYADAFRARPTVRVAVPDLADPVGPFPQSPAAERVCRLLYVPVLATSDEASLRGETPGQLLADWKLGELGAAWRIGLKSDFRWADGSRPVSAVDVARSLADRASPGSPGYNARWADLLDRIDVDDSGRVAVRLTRATARPETWLIEAVGPAHAAADGWVSSVAGGRVPVGDGPFAWQGGDATATRFEASTTATPELTPKIRRIVEVRAASPLALVDRIARGEVDVIDRVPPADLIPLGKRPDVRIGRYAVPSLHRLAIDGRTAVLGNRKLRRALSMAIDRATLLGEEILGHPSDDENRPLDAPFVRGSFVADPAVPPLEYNPVLAKGLVAAAVKETGGAVIHLTLEYPAVAEAQATAPKIAAAFRAIGIEIDLIEASEAALEAGLRAGRRFDLAYRACRPTDPLRDAGPILIPAYDAPTSAGGFESAASPRILQLLVDLDRAPEPQSARRLAQQVDREARDELPVIPLWQVVDHYAWRANIVGIPETADQLYHAVLKWEASPWLAVDP